MAIYDAVCLICHTEHEYVRRIADCMDTPVCCGGKTEKRIFSAPHGIVDIPAYESPATGKWITSRAERREDFKRSGCREWEGIESERKVQVQRTKDEAVKQDAALDATVRKAWAQLPPSKKEAALSVA